MIFEERSVAKEEGRLPRSIHKRASKEEGLPRSDQNEDIILKKVIDQANARATNSDIQLGACQVAKLGKTETHPSYTVHKVSPRKVLHHLKKALFREIRKKAPLSSDSKGGTRQTRAF